MSLINIINEFVVDNVENSIKFYESYFDFKTILTEGTPVTWARIEKDNFSIMFEEYNTVKNEIDNFPDKVKSSNLIKFEYEDVQDVKNIYEKLKQDNIEFFMEYTKTDYGKIEFGIYDIDRNMILVSAVI